MNKKAYHGAIRKLKRYCKNSNIKVVRLRPRENDKMDTEAEWRPQTRTVILHPDLETSPRLLASFLHELGHMRDDYLQQAKKSRYNRIEKAYERFNLGGRLTPGQKDLVLETERNAWDHGVAISKELNIRLGSWYDKVQREALGEIVDILWPRRQFPG